MPSKTFLKQTIDGKDRKIKQLEFENKQLSNAIKELHMKNEHLQTAYNEKCDLIKYMTENHKKWYEFWK